MSEVHLVLELARDGAVLACTSGRVPRDRATQTLLAFWATCPGCRTVQDARVAALGANRS